MWLDSTAQRRYVMDGITELACFLRKNRDLSIENSLRLIECTLAPLLAFSGPVIIWPEKEFNRLTAAFVRCNKEAWQMSPNTSTALFTFPKDRGGLQIKMQGHHMLSHMGSFNPMLPIRRRNKTTGGNYIQRCPRETRVSGYGRPPI